MGDVDPPSEEHGEKILLKDIKETICKISIIDIMTNIQKKNRALVKRFAVKTFHGATTMFLSFSHPDYLPGQATSSGHPASSEITRLGPTKRFLPRIKYHPAEIVVNPVKTTDA